MDWDALKKLVDQWHDAAKTLPGYQDTTINNEDGVQLLLMVNRSKDGDLVLQVMATKDWLSTISPRDLLQASDIETADEPTIPVASLTIQKG